MDDATPRAAAMTRKLSHFISMGPEEAALLEVLAQERSTVSKGEVLVHEGEFNRSGFFLQSGWAMRHRTLENGRRQVVNFIVPGEFSEPGLLVTGCADHSITALTDAELLLFPHTAWFSLFARSGRIAAALWWMAAHEEALLKEHVVTVGRRSAYERVAYLAWELRRRLMLSAVSADQQVRLPVTREVLADALGLTPRHVGRTLNRLERDGVLSFRQGVLEIHDPAALSRIADCHDSHLQIAPLSSEISALLS